VEQISPLVRAYFLLSKKLKIKSVRLVDEAATGKTTLEWRAASLLRIPLFLRACRGVGAGRTNERYHANVATICR
jgi:hypothetical protein